MNTNVRASNRLTLRMLERSDAAQIAEWLNDPDVNKWLPHESPIGALSIEQWIDAFKTNRTFGFGIVLAEGNEFIGMTTIQITNPRHKTALAGTLIGNKAYWRKGYAREAKDKTMNIAFNQLNLIIVEDHIFADDTVAIAGLENYGYQLVGRIPGYFYRNDNSRADKIIYVITKDLWESKQSSNITN